MIDDLMSFDLFDLSHIWCHTGAYSLFQSRFVDLHGFAWSSPVVRYTSSWWFDFILSRFSGGAFIESLSQAHIFQYCHDSWVELLQAHRFSHHHFSGVHVRSFMHPHGVILPFSGQIGYIWCHARAYSFLKLWRWSFSHKSVTIFITQSRDTAFALLVTIHVIFIEMSFRWSTTFRLWLSCYPWPRSRLFWWDRGSYPSGLFFWDSLVDYPFEMTMDSSNRAFRDRDIWLIVTSRQASWSRRMGCEAMFIVDLIIPTHYQSISWGSRSVFYTFSKDGELWRHATLRHIPPHPPIIFLPFGV